MNNLPIGVFDSGLGGLTVVQAIRRVMPSEKIIYLGDSARVPYGTRSAQTVVRYARTCSGFLTTMGLKMLVVACNTASAVAMPSLQKEIDIPVLGVITAGAKAVVGGTFTNGAVSRVGVIGTAGTIQSGAYPAEIASINPDLKVFGQSAPLLVPLAEEGWIDGEVPELAAMRYLEPLVESQIETLLLGCTHYPLLSNSIKRALGRLGSNATVIDSASAMAADVNRTLQDHGLEAPPQHKRQSLNCFVTDRASSFNQVATRFLGEPIGEVEVVDIS